MVYVVCVHDVYVHGVCTWCVVCVCLWRPEVDVMYLFWRLFTLCIEAEILT